MTLDSELLGRYVEKALVLREQGVDVDLAELCVEHPEILAEVEATLALAPDLAAWVDRPRQRDDPRLGASLGGRYRILEPIGRGAMGAVYLARDDELDREVAVKILERRWVDDTQEERFDRESRVLARLDHRHLVRVYDRGRVDEDTRFLVMERLVGSSLATVLQTLAERANTRPGSAEYLRTEWLRDDLGLQVRDSNLVRTFAVWTAELASGLAAAHAAGILHRDVKPSNIHLGQDGRAVLLDFGIAVFTSDATTLAADGLGTPSYMAPEQAAANSRPTPGVDIYGLGASLYHMLTGRPPYLGDPRSVLAQVTRRDPPPAERLHPGLPRDLAAIVDRAMARSPHQRYASAAEFEADLRAFLDHRPVAARPLRPWTRVWRRARRRPEFRVAVVCMLLLGLTMAARAMWNSRAAARAERHTELLVHRLPLLGLTGPPQDRRMTDESARLATRRHLERAIELAPDDIVDRLHRSSFLLDHGEPAAAALDMEHIAATEGSEYLTRLAERYRSLDPDADGHDHLELAGLPDPRGASDRYVAAYLAIRGKTVAGYRSAHELLADPAQSGYLPAAGLRLVTSLVMANLEREPTERRGQFRGVEAAAQEYRGLVGRDTARITHVIGAALRGQHRYQDAIQPLRRCIELAPAADGASMNLADAYSRLGKLDEARRILERVLTRRPKAFQASTVLIETLIDQHEFDAALARIESLGAPPAGKEFVPDCLRGRAHFERAWQLDAVDKGAAARSALAAMDAYRSAGETGWPDANVEAAIGRCELLMSRDYRGALDAVLASLQQEPMHSDNLNYMLELLPQVESFSVPPRLLSYLHALRRELPRSGF